MASKNKVSKGTKKTEASPAFEESPKYSYEFLDMLVDTAFSTLREHLMKKGLTREADLVDMTHVLVIESTNLSVGGEQTNDSLPLYVAKAVHYISEFGGEWYSENGPITRLEEWLELKRARGKS